MTIPRYDALIEPVLRFLGAQTSSVTKATVCVAIADALGLSASDRAQRLPSGTQPTYQNRIGWAYDRLKRAELAGSERRGYWIITDRGAQLLKQFPQSIPREQILQIASANLNKRLVDVDLDRDDNPCDSPALSPMERIEGALQLHGASKGVFLTSGKFTKDASQTAERARGTIILVDGDKLTQLCINHGVGVGHQELRVPKIDNDYFEEYG